MKNQAFFKRVISLALCAIFVLSAFAGCNKGSKTDTPDGDPSGSSKPVSPSSDQVINSGADSGI
ncbi:MAG: hypothetical protein IJX59_04720, partial [Clostridia bacterium]|nr:hypothetical protein [Clostridia bacterium]